MNTKRSFTRSNLRGVKTKRVKVSVNEKVRGQSNGEKIAKKSVNRQNGKASENKMTANKTLKRFIYLLFHIFRIYGANYS
jgi:hypothetical protein